MSDDMKAALDKALSRIAALESNKHSSAPQGQQFDPAEFAQQMARDPAGTLRKYNIPVDHVTNVLVGTALGDKATPELRMLASQGPQVSAQLALQKQLEDMRQRLESFESGNKKQAAKASFSTLTADKTKYPLLSAAYAKASSLFDEDIESHKGDAAELATRLEARLKATAEAVGYTPPASDGKADSAKGQSDEASRAQGATDGNIEAFLKKRGVDGGGTVDPTPPNDSTVKQGLFTKADHEALKDRILRKFS